jgi:hypothetical protein
MPSGKFFNYTEAPLKPDIPRSMRRTGVDGWPERLIRGTNG